MSIQEQFIRSMDRMPKRVVIHKRTPFKEEEVKGIVDALAQANITNVDLISITEETKIRCTDHLGFTKMNWNSFNMYTKLPATIDTSNTLAKIENMVTSLNGNTFDDRYFI